MQEWKSFKYLKKSPIAILSLAVLFVGATVTISLLSLRSDWCWVVGAFIIFIGLTLCICSFANMHCREDLEMNKKNCREQVSMYKQTLKDYKERDKNLDYTMSSKNIKDYRMEMGADTETKNN